MAKALFFSLPLAGHINPSLGLVRELVDRGDEVVYYATDPYSSKIGAARARYAAYGNAFLDDMRDLPDHLHELSWLLMRTTAEVLDKHVDAFRAERPDYLITDSVAPWGQWVAQILRVPVVTSVPTFAINRRVMAYAARHGVRPKSPRLIWSKLRHMGKAFVLGRRMRRRYGVPGQGIIRTVCGRSDLNIVYTSRCFQPCAETFDGRYQFIGPSLAGRADIPGFPWDEVRHPVVVYASFGTLFNADVSGYRACFEAFAAQDLQVILSIGSNVSERSLGALPSNFIVRSQVPQLDVLQRCAAFVTHGGMNSVSESLYYGVPVVVIPQMSEQEMVGRRVEELGAGLCVAKAQVTPEKLRESVQRLLSEPRFRERAEVIRDSFLAAGGVARAAGAIVDFTKKVR